MAGINIGVITYNMFPQEGGVGRVIHEIYTRRLVYDSDLNFHFFSPHDVNLPNHTQVAGFSSKFGQNLTFSLVVNKNIAHWVREKKLNLINFHRVFLFKKLNIPVVYTCHGTYYRQYRSDIREIWKWILMQLEKESYKHADRIVAVSKDTGDIIKERYVNDEKKIKVIYNGVDKAEFNKLGHIEKIKSSLLFVGRLERAKGIKLLIKQVIPLVKKEIPDIKLFVAGSGSQKQELETYSMYNGLDSNIVFLGWVSGQELVTWYNQVYGMILPTKREGFNLSIMEAMSCGTPVIATNIPPNTEIITDGENGLLVEYGDIKAIAQSIVELLSDEEKRTKLSIAGRKTVEEKFTWDLAAREMKFYILNLLSNR
jgi:glycosyltransferase involved in cell wall biosynthesis